jgi:hypothetical protein
MSDTATAACDDFFSRMYRSFANGRLPRADDEVKALVDYFSIEISQISYRLRKWRNQSKVPGELLDLGDKFRDGVGADLEERVGDGLDLVEIAVDEMLLRESALKEDPDLESIRATIAGSDEVKTFLCAVIAAWCSLVLMCTAKNVNSTGVLELELIKARRASREKNASEFADIMGGLLATGFPTSKIRLFFWLLERRLWDCFSTALRADEHPVLIVPTSQPLFPAADLGWLGPLVAYLAGWLLRRTELTIKSCATPPNKGFWAAWVFENAVTSEGADEAQGVPMSLIRSRSKGGLKMPSLKLYEFVMHVETACLFLLSESMLFQHGKTHIQKVIEAILKSACIRESFVRTTHNARAMAPVSTEENTTTLLKFVVDTWFHMRGPDFVAKIRKKIALSISQQGKSLALRPKLAAASSSAGGADLGGRAAEKGYVGDEQDAEEPFSPCLNGPGDCILQCSEMDSLMDGLEAEVDTPCYCEEDVHGDDAFNDEKLAAVAVAEVLVSAAADTMSANSEANRAFITN